MEIRALRASEIDKMIALQCQIFRPDGHERYTQYVRGDSSYRLDQTRIGLEDGRMVCILRVWDRLMRVGSCPVRMGGIGGVGTLPDFRGAGRASALMRDTSAYLRQAGYHIGLLFSEVPCRFYGRLGWSRWPLPGFRLQIRHISRLEAKDWDIIPFNEKRDLEDVVKLYEAHNAHHSGTIVRSRAHWDTVPARMRGVLPTVVARRGNTFGGYLNFQLAERQAHVLEVAYKREDPTILAALTDHLLQVCAQNDSETIIGEMPHAHPLVELLTTGADGDLHLTGRPGSMFYLVDLPGLMQQLLPDLQARLDAAAATFASCALQLIVGEHACSLQLHDSGHLCLTEEALNAIPLPLPVSLFWRLLFGESSWPQLEPAASALGLKVSDELSSLLTVLFPAQNVLFWSPDHF